MSVHVYDVADGAPVVRGTTDVEAAREAVLEYELSENVWDDDWAEVFHIIGRVYRYRVIRQSWFRFNPCHESSCFDGGGHTWHLGYAGGRGRGNWQGVYFD